MCDHECLLLTSLERMFRALSTFSFTAMIQCTWVVVILWVTIEKIERNENFMSTDFASASTIKALRTAAWLGFFGHIFGLLLDSPSLSCPSQKWPPCERVTGLILNFCRTSKDWLDFRAPTSGGQYHWVSEFAPPRYQHILSYLTG